MHPTRPRGARPARPLDSFHPLPTLARRFAMIAAIAALALGTPGPSARGQDVPPSAEETAPPPKGESPEHILDLGQEVITASRDRVRAFEESHLVDVIDRRRFLDRQYRTVPEALRDVPGVLVQKTGHGQASPFLRGFTGFHNVFLIDGVRLNNSIFRPGPNQYWSTVDPLSVDRLEVVKGPASVLYGSDAIGGAVNLLTLDPRLQGEDRSVSGRLFARGSTAERSLIGRGEVDLTVRGGRLGILAGATGKDFGDLEGGRHVGTQANTGYTDVAGDVKAIYQLSSTAKLVVLYQKLRQNDAPRTHKTVDAIAWQGLSTGSDIQRDLDQERDLAYVQLHAEDLGGPIETFRASLSWHRQQELQDRIKSSGSRQRTGHDVDTYGFWAQATSTTLVGHLTYGVDWYHDEVESFSSSNAIQGPVGDDSRYDLGGLFVDDRIPVCEQLDVILGGRLTYAAVQAGDVEDFATGNRTNAEDDYFAATGSARFVWTPDPWRRWNVFGAASQAFRAPNLSDLTRLDDFGTDGFEVPATNLDPEEFLTFEIGAKLDTDRVAAQAAYYYTLVDDLILRVPDRPNPSDPTQTIFEKQNSGDGYVQGVEVAGSWRVLDTWSLFGTIAWMDGRVDYVDSANNVRGDDLSRLLPVSGISGVRWNCPHEPIWVEGMAQFAERQDDLSVRDQSDTSRIPPRGTPGYAVFSLRSGWRYSDALTLRAGIENIFDTDYRVHGSGLNEPGRSFVFSAEYRF